MNRIIKDLPAEDYHADPSVSKHRLDLVRRSINHYLHPPKFDSPALEFGTWAHSIVLEPDDFAARLVEVDVKGKTTKTFKEAKAAAPPGSFVMTSQELHQLQQLAAAVKRHPIAEEMLAPDAPGALIEPSFFWKDTRTQIDCKCRPDYVCDRWIVDFKTCQTAAAKDFERDAAKYRYHVQAAWYSHGVSMVTGEHPKRFLFVAVEKRPPYGVAIFEYHPEALNIALADALIDLQKIANYRANSKTAWTGYPLTIQKLNLPRWAHDEVI